MSDNKINFIKKREQESTIPEYYLNSLFETCAAFEEEFDKDLCNFSTEEAEIMLKAMDFKSVASFMVAKTHLKQYVDWCIEQRVDGCGENPFDKITIDEAPRFINKAYLKARIVPRKEVLRWCSQVPNASDCVVLLGLFEGIRGKDFCELTEMKRGDVDFDSKMIRLQGREKPFEASTVLISYIETSIETSVYNATTGELNRQIQLAPSDKVIKDQPNIAKGEVTSFRRGRRIYTRLSRLFDFLGVGEWMTAKAIFDSGIIHMIRTESKKLGITCDEYLAHFRSEVNDRYNVNLDVYMLRKQYGDFLK